MSDDTATVDEELTSVELVSRRGHFPRLYADLTPRQMEQLKDAPRSDDGAVFNHGLSYLDPSSVKAYALSDGTLIHRPPKLVVGIDFRDDWEGRSWAGSYSFTHEFSPAEVEARESQRIYPASEEHILNGSVSKEDVLKGRIDPRYVIQDHSGLVVPITPRSILKGVRGLRKRMRQYPLSSPDFKTLERLADVADINVSGIMGRLREERGIGFRRAYDTPEHLESVIGNLERMDEYRFGISTDVEIDFHEEAADFIDQLPHINFPDDELRDRAKTVLRRIIDLQEGEVRRTRATYAETRAREDALVDDLNAARTNLIFLSGKVFGPDQ